MDELKRAEDPIGPENDRYISRVARRVERDGGKVVLAWGTRGVFLGRDQAVLALLHGADVWLYHLGRTKDGHPRHPLYLKANTPLRLWLNEKEKV